MIENRLFSTKNISQTATLQNVNIENRKIGGRRATKLQKVKYFLPIITKFDNIGKISDSRGKTIEFHLVRVTRYGLKQSGDTSLSGPLTLSGTQLECGRRFNLGRMSDEELDFGDQNADDGEAEEEQPSPSVIEEGEAISQVSGPETQG